MSEKKTPDIIYIPEYLYDTLQTLSKDMFRSEHTVYIRKSSPR
jgi:hypothetical protein